MSPAGERAQLSGWKCVRMCVGGSRGFAGGLVVGWPCGSEGGVGREEGHRE